jgi:hypothetical protein
MEAGPWGLRDLPRRIGARAKWLRYDRCMPLTWHLLDARLGDKSPWSLDLAHRDVRALVVSVHDPDVPGTWRAAEHGEQRSQGAGFHATYEHGDDRDRVTVHFDGRLRSEPIRIAYAVPGAESVDQ